MAIVHVTGGAECAFERVVQAILVERGERAR